MTNEKRDTEKKTTTEQQYIGFRTVPDNLEHSLKEYGCMPKEFKRGNAWRAKGKRYIYMEQKTFGTISILYQEGKEISSEFMPGREEGNIAALVNIHIITGITAVVSDQPTIDARDALVTFLLNTYRTSTGAFLYLPSSDIKRETA